MRPSAARRIILPPMQWMPSSKSKAILGALSLLALLPSALHPQAPILITVEDASGASLAGATVSDAANHSLGRTASSGTLAVACTPPCRITISAPGFAPQTLMLTAPETIHLQPSAGAEQITVTAYRAPLGDLESPATTRAALAAGAGHHCRHHARRSAPAASRRRALPPISSRSLPTPRRRASACAASVPLPPAARSSPRTMCPSTIRSAAGSTGRSSPSLPSTTSNWSAAAPAISTVPAPSAASSMSFLCTPPPTPAELTSTYGGEGTYDNERCSHRSNAARGACSRPAGILGTDGYIQEAPSQRGPVDVASNVHSQNALVARRTRRRSRSASSRA